MKFRLSATIAIYFLFTLLCFTLFITSASNKTKENALIDLNHQVLGIIINQLLTIQDILILRKTCKLFGNLLSPNDEGMVTFYNYNHSPKLINVDLFWINLGYFLNECYDNALHEMEIFTIKDDQYAVLTHAHPQKIISWLKKNVANNRKRKRFKKIIDFDSPTSFEPLIKVYTKFKQVQFHCLEFIKGGIVRDNGGHEKCECKIPESLLPKLTKIKTIVPTISAFAALLYNGDVFAWGKKECGGLVPSEIQTQNIKMIFSTNYAFAALANDGNVLAWGLPDGGGKIPHDVQSKLKNVKMIYSNEFSFVALLDDGKAVSWGLSFFNGCTIHAADPQNVKMIFSTSNAFAALLNDGSVCGWGFGMQGGKIPSEVQSKLKNVKMILSNGKIFTALLQDGGRISWKDPDDLIIV